MMIRPMARMTGVALTLLAQAITQAAEVHAVMLSGVDDERGPGLGTGYTFSASNSRSAYLVPGLSGVVVFNSALKLNGANSGSGEFYFDGNTNSVQVRTGVQAPGFASGVKVGSMDDYPLANSNGDFRTCLVLTGTGITSNNDRTMVVYNHGAASIVQENTQIPGMTPGTYYLRFEDYGWRAFGNAGVLFNASMKGANISSSNDVAIVVGQPNSLAVIAREGDQIPNMPSGILYSQEIYTRFISGNDVLIQGNQGTTSVLTLYRDGVYTLLAQKGVTTMSNKPGKVLSGDMFNLVSTANEKYFISTNLSDGVSTTSSLVMGDTSGAMSSLLETGDVMPGTTNTFNSIRNYEVSSDGHYIVFTAMRSDATYGIYRYNTITGTTVKVAEEGDGNLNNGTLENLQDATARINKNGVVVFTPGAYGSSALYSYDDVNGLILEVAGQLDVDNGLGVDLRTITQIVLPDAGVGNPTYTHADGSLYFSDDNVVVFNANFSNGSAGTFTALIPEPSSLVIISLACVGLLQRRK